MTRAIEEAQRHYADRGIITFGIELGQHWSEKYGKWKKAVLPPKGFQTFTVDALPKIRPHDNALGLVCGKVNNIFALDIDNPSHFEAILKHVDKPEPLTCKQISASGGFHLIFEYDQRLINFKGRSGCIRGRPDYEIDTRTNGNFLYIEPTKFESKDVTWVYKWVEKQSLLEMKPLPMPDWLFNLLEIAKNSQDHSASSNKAAPSRQTALFPDAHLNDNTSKVPYADKRRLCQQFMGKRASNFDSTLLAQHEATTAKKNKKISKTT